MLLGLAKIEQEAFPAPGPPLEDSLILAVGQGDERAFTELYLRAHKAVFGFALSIVKHRQDAEDVMQDTFLRADGAAARYEPRGKPMAWLLTIARNLALERLRARRDMPLEQEDWQGLGAHDPTEEQEDRMILEAAMELLSDEERQVLTLHAMSGLKHRETAALLGLPLSTVLSKYRRSLIKLKTYLEEVEQV